MPENSTDDTYEFESEDQLSEKIREAVAEERGEDADDVNLELYDDVDPDALDDLLHEDARPETAVELHSNAVRVKLWGDGTMEIEVLDAESDP